MEDAFGGTDTEGPTEQDYRDGAYGSVIFELLYEADTTPAFNPALATPDR